MLICQQVKRYAVYLECSSVSDDMVAGCKDVAKVKFLERGPSRHLEHAEQLEPVVLGQGLTTHPLEHWQHILQQKMENKI